MEAKAVQKFVKQTPRKLRLVSDAIKDKTPQEALEILPFIRKRGSEVVAKTINTAIANARVKGMDESRLIFKSLQINEGPRLKRFRPVSKGRAHGYVKQMSHVRVVLSEKEEKTKKSKVVKKVNKK